MIDGDGWVLARPYVKEIYPVTIALTEEKFGEASLASVEEYGGVVFNGGLHVLDRIGSYLKVYVPQNWGLRAEEKNSSSGTGSFAYEGPLFPEDLDRLLDTPHPAALFNYPRSALYLAAEYTFPHLLTLNTIDSHQGPMFVISGFGCNVMITPDKMDEFVTIWAYLAGFGGSMLFEERSVDDVKIHVTRSIFFEY